MKPYEGDFLENDIIWDKACSMIPLHVAQGETIKEKK